MAEILDKTKEWSERFGHVLRASAETQFPHLYKGAVGGLEHVISVDNGGSYMEMWRDGGDQYYATTGAAIKPLPGLAKGARLDEALDRFFVLMTKVHKGKDIRGQAYRRGKGQRRMNPMKRGRAVAKQPWYQGSKLNPNRPRPPVRKNVVEKVDPEIGPSMSIGHDKPSNLSPESSVRKLAKLIIADINKTTAAAYTRYAPHGPDKPHTPGGKCPNCPKPAKRPTKKNVVALTGNQPGSGRVKPPKPTPKTYRSPQGFSGQRMGQPGAPQAPRSGAVRGPGRFGKGRKIDDIEGGWTQPGGGTRQVRMPKAGSPGAPGGYGSTGQPQYRYGRKARTEVDKAIRAVEQG